MFTSFLAGIIIMSWVAMIVLATPTRNDDGGNGLMVAVVAFTLSSVVLAFITLFTSNSP